MRKLPRLSDILLFGICIGAAYLRFNNLNWDLNFHLHPDERFLTMVGNAMQFPTTVSQYLSPTLSKLNPANINFPFFVYGVFPITLNKLIAVFSGYDNYNGFTIVGRFLSGLVDIFTVLLVYKTAKLLVNKQTSNIQHQTSNIPLWSAFFYAIAVLPIQLSHYFAVDTFLNFFMFGSFYFTLKFQLPTLKSEVGEPRVFLWRYLFLSAIFFGLALASKITAVFILPLNLFFVVFCFWLSLRGASATKQSQSKIMRLLHFVRNDRFILFIVLYIIISYFTLRLADPYIFQNSNFFDPRPNNIFVQNLQSLKSFEGKDIWYPPGIQWISKNPTFSLINLAMFGVGIPYFVLILVGAISIISKFQFLISNQTLKSKLHISKKNLATNYYLLTTLFWVLGFFIYQSFQFVKAMRYFIFIYPFLAIFAGIGMNYVISNLLFVIRKYKINQKIFLAISYLLLATILVIWPFAFASIYTNKNSRVAASEWIYDNIPDNSFIVSEHWDDALPLPMDRGKQYVIKELPVFAPDDEAKWNEMSELLAKADYYILSSNRGWGSIPTVPEKYPIMSKFYKDLLTDKLPHYKKIKEFVSYPQLPITNYQLQIVDSGADESFTVYDHPKVIIFKKEKY